MPKLRRASDGPALLAKALEKRRLSQLRAEAMTGIPQPCFSRYLAKKSKPDFRNAVLLWQYFGVPPESWIEAVRGGSTWRARLNGSTEQPVVSAAKPSTSPR
jgi:hypothetical protein